MATQLRNVVTVKDLRDELCPLCETGFITTAEKEGLRHTLSFAEVGMEQSRMAVIGLVGAALSGAVAASIIWAVWLWLR